MKISVVKRGEDYVAMGGPENSGGDKEEVFSVTGHNESLLKTRAMDEARKRGIQRVIGLNVDT